MSARAPLAILWADMGGWRWPCVALILVSIGLTPLAGPSRAEWVPAERLDDGPPTGPSLWSRHRAGSSEIELRFEAAAGDDPGDYVLRIGDGEWQPLPREIRIARPAPGSAQRVRVCSKAKSAVISATLDS